MNCLECQQLLQIYLDGQPLPSGASFDGHLAACPACREQYAAALRLLHALRLLAPPSPPAGLGERITARVLADRRARLRFRRRLLYTGLAVAASLLLVVLAGYFRRPSPAVLQQQPLAELTPATTAPPPSLRDSMAEAGSAVASLTRRTADSTVDQTRILLPMPMDASVLDDTGTLGQTLDPPARSLREAGQTVGAGLEPVTSSARRAVSLFLRELPPMEAENKPRSQ